MDWKLQTCVENIYGKCGVSNWIPFFFTRVLCVVKIMNLAIVCDLFGMVK